MKRGWAAGLLVAAIFLVFGGSIRNGLVYDDHPMVERNPVVRTLDPAAHLRGDFWSRRETSFAYFRPLVTWSLAVDYRLHGARPAGYHVTNLLLHAAATILLFSILSGLGRPEVAGLGAAIFALHPIQSEAVLWVVGRTDLLATLFLLLAALLHAGLPDRPRWSDLPRIAAVLAAASAALLSKETGVTFPALAFALDLGRARADGLGWRESWSRLRGRIWRFGPLYLLLIGAYLFARSAVLGHWLPTAAADGASGFNPLLGATTAERLLTAVHVFGRYAGLVFWPARLSVDYLVDVVPVVQRATSAAFVLPLLALLVLVAGSVLLALRSAAALFGLSVAAGTYLLVSNLVFAAPVAMAERLMYLPMVGVSALIAAGLALVLDRAIAPRRRMAATIAAFSLVLVPLGVRSQVRTSDWKDDLSLFASAVRATPRSAQSWHNLGYQYLGRKEYGPALEAIDRALEIHPGFLRAQLVRAEIQEKSGDLAGAERSARATVAEFPRAGAARFALVRILTLRAGELASRGEAQGARRLREDAIELARATTESSPGSRAVLLQAEGENLAALGRLAEAERAFVDATTAADEEHGAVDEAGQGVRTLVHAAAAAFFRDAGRPAEAAAHFALAADAATAAGQDETASRLLLEAGAQATAAGQPAAALRAYDRLLALDPTSERARYGRARARLASGDTRGAEADLQQLLAGEPRGKRAAAIWFELARLARARGDLAAARERLERCLSIDPAHAGAREQLNALP